MKNKFINKQVLKTSTTIDEIKSNLPQNSISLKNFFEDIGNKGRYILIIILSAPFLIPVSIPGSSTPFGLFIFLLEFCNLLNRKVYLPKIIMNYELSYKNVIKIFDVLEKAMSYVEKIVKPRLLVVVENKVVKVLKSICVMILSFLLLLPLPVPLTDFVPAVSILMLSVSTLEKDGLVILIGFLLTVLSIGYFMSIGYLGVETIRFVLFSLLHI